MQETTNDFNQRLSEIELYFTFLQNLDKDNPVLSFEIMDVKKQQIIENELLKILKANAFLLIYNLIEASFRNALWDILQAVQTENCTYKTVQENIAKIWLRETYKSTIKDTIIRDMQQLAQGIINEVVLNFDIKLVKREISGSLDAKSIREIAKRYGFSSSVLEESKGDDLLKVKTNRNNLAHGDNTFIECGREYSVRQITQIKDNVVEYMKAILSNIESFIQDKGFLK